MGPRNRKAPEVMQDRVNPVDWCYRRLWSAVINQAIDDITGVFDWRDKNSVHWRTLRREQAEAWMKSQETGCGSFLWICDNLKLSPEKIQKGISQVKHHEKHFPRPIPGKALDRGQRHLLAL